MTGDWNSMFHVVDVEGVNNWGYFRIIVSMSSTIIGGPSASRLPIRLRRWGPWIM